MDNYPQEDIQQKMSDIYNVCFNNDDFSKEVRSNGLCGGWVFLYKDYPAWLYEIWNILGNYQDEISLPSDLKNLNKFIKTSATRNSGLVNEKEPYKQILLALGEAWNYMNDLEKDANYGKCPNGIERIISERGMKSNYKIKKEEKLNCTYKKKDSEIANLLTNYLYNSLATIIKGNSQGSAFYVIETDIHYMGLHVIWSKSGIDVYIIETEKIGIVKESFNTNDIKKQKNIIWQFIYNSYNNNLYAKENMENIDYITIRTLIVDNR